jgi:hypothetical protein
MKISQHVILPLAALALTATSAHAAVVTTGVNAGTTQLAYSGDVSASDLLTGLTATTTGWNFASGATPANLNDGTGGTSFDDVAGASIATIAWTTVGATAEYNLGTGANGLGFDITSIQSIADWNGVGFGNQGYTVEVRPVGGSYSTIATIDYQPLSGAGSTKVTVTEDTTGVVASGIESIRFTANLVNGGANGGAFTAREIDVNGSSTAIPEPSALALLGLGGLALLRRRRRD